MLYESADAPLRPLDEIANQGAPQIRVRAGNHYRFIPHSAPLKRAGTVEELVLFPSDYRNRLSIMSARRARIVTFVAKVNNSTVLSLKLSFTNKS